MGNDATITLHCVYKDGRRDRTKLSLQTLSQARDVAKRILRLGGGLYTEVDICNDHGTIETIQSTAPSPLGTSAEVLLVEDNAGDALLVRQALAECQIHVHLHIARDGEQALEILGESDFQPDLIILDLNIPKISGFTVLASYPMKKAPVVVFTASDNKADADRALSLGASGCVHKPMDLDDYKSAVCGMVQKWVRREEIAVF